MEFPTVREKEIEQALCRSVFYRALALGFRPPTRETLEALASPEGLKVLRAAASALDTPQGLGLGAWVLELARFGSKPLEALSASFQRLFGHAVRGLLSPYETEYGEGGIFQKTRELSDLGGFYRAFGLAPNPLAYERIDHMSYECEFLLFLTLKEAYALEEEREDLLRETRRAERLFLRDHLGRFGPAWGRKLGREDPGGFYGTLGEICAEFLTQECARWGVPVGPETLRLRTAEDEGVPMACAGGEGCPLKAQVDFPGGEG